MWPRLVMVGLAAALAFAAAALLFSTTRAGEEAPVQSYARTANPNVIAVRFFTGPGGRVIGQSAAEDAQRIRVSVRITTDTWPNIAIGIPQSVSITLSQPLGERAVVDANGNPVRKEP